MKKLFALILCIIILGTCCFSLASCTAADNVKVEDITGTSTDPFHYKVHFYTALPDIDVNK